MEQAGGKNALEAYAQNYDDPFLAIWNYIEEHGINGWQHEYMADYYIQFIANGLKELHTDLSSQGFIDYKTGSNVYDQTWSWNELFYYMAWRGLQETVSFQTEIVNRGKEKYYKFYNDEVKSESQSYKCN